LRNLRRLDDGLARGEAAIAAFVLLVLILVAASQALLRNLTLSGVESANAILEHMAWADTFMQKATLWLAFVGASLATHGEKHIAIDVLGRILPKRGEAMLRGVVWIAAGVTCFFLGRVFLASVMNNAADIPFEYQVMDMMGESLHLCDASAAAAAESGLEQPMLFCGARSFLILLGAPASTPDTALQLIVPAMLVVMCFRFVLKGLLSLLRATGQAKPEPAKIASERPSAPPGPMGDA